MLVHSNKRLNRINEQAMYLICVVTEPNISAFSSACVWFDVIFMLNHTHTASQIDALIPNSCCTANGNRKKNLLRVAIDACWKLFCLLWMCIFCRFHYTYMKTSVPVARAFWYYHYFIDIMREPCWALLRLNFGNDGAHVCILFGNLMRLISIFPSQIITKADVIVW